MSVSLFVQLPANMSLCLAVCQSIDVCVCVFACLFCNLSVCLSVSLSVCLSVCLCLSLSVSLYVCVSPFISYPCLFSVLEFFPIRRLCFLIPRPSPLSRPSGFLSARPQPPLQPLLLALNRLLRLCPGNATNEWTPQN